MPAPHVQLGPKIFERPLELASQIGELVEYLGSIERPVAGWQFEGNSVRTNTNLTDLTQAVRNSGIDIPEKEVEHIYCRLFAFSAKQSHPITALIYAAYEENLLDAGSRIGHFYNNPSSQFLYAAVLIDDIWSYLGVMPEIDYEAKQSLHGPLLVWLEYLLIDVYGGTVYGNLPWNEIFLDDRNKIADLARIIGVPSDNVDDFIFSVLKLRKKYAVSVEKSVDNRQSISLRLAHIPVYQGVRLDGDPVEYLNRWRSSYEKAGLYYRSAVELHDPKLIKTLYRWCGRAGILTDNVMPPRTREDLASLSPEQRVERTKEQGQRRTARYRAKQPGPQ